jgi:hypothetical protein
MTIMKLKILIVGLIAQTLFAQPSIRLDIQNNIGSLKGQAIVKVVVHDIVDLDTYSFDVAYDTAQCLLKFADISAPMINISNCLQDGVRTILPIVKKEAGVVHVSATVAGDEPTGDAAKDCVIAVLLFAPRSKSGAVTAALCKVTLLDNKRNRIPCTIAGTDDFDKGTHQ